MTYLAARGQWASATLDGMEGGTLLAGDVEGAALLWETDAVRMAAAVARLAEAVGAEADLHGGIWPAQQPADSFVAVFGRPVDAVAAALGILGRLSGAGDDPAGLTLPVRLAVHPDAGPGPAPSGPGRHRACALRDLGHGGQLLVAGPLPDAPGALPPDVEVVDLGHHRLPGPRRTVHVFQVARAGTGTPFPALNPGPPAGNLPVERTSFVGRQAEVAATLGLIGRHRVVTLTGSGGCGKTRLALRVAAEGAAGYPDGVWFCDLSGATGDDQVAGALAATFALPDRAGLSALERITGHLAGVGALVVLDNCEHVIGGAASLVDALLGSCPDVTVLATSREPLGVRGEVTSAVGSLAVPPEDGTEGHAGDYESVQLFVERARAVQPAFVLSDTSRAAVAEVCRRLDGIPLAVELAAARVAVLTPDQIAAGLHDRFRTLGHGSPRGVARQQTLAASVGWSYDLLSGEERITLRRVSVFAGGFDLPAAVAVATSEGTAPGDVLDLMGRLISRSLVVADESDGGMRYRLLETIRQYMVERLHESGEADAVAARHLGHYSDLVHRELRAAARGERQDAALQRVDTEYDNVTAALGCALHGDLATGVRLVGWLHRYWVTRGRYEEGRRWAAAFGAAGEAGGVPAASHASVLLVLNSMLQYLGDLPGAVAAGDRAIELARRAGDARVEARALTVAGWPRGLLDLSAGISALREAETAARAVGDHLSLVESLLAHAYLVGVRDGVGPCQAVLEEGLEAAAASGNEIAALPLRSGAGWNQVLSGEPAAGIVALEATLADLERANFPYWAGFTLVELAFGHLLAGDLRRAHHRCLAAIAIGERLANPALTLTGHSYRATVARAACRPADLDRAVASTLRLAPTLGGWMEATHTATALALRARATVDRHPAAALEDVEAALAAVGEQQVPMSSGMVRTAAAAVFFRLDDLDAATEQGRRALAELHSAGLISLVPEVLDVIAALHLRGGDPVAAARLQGAVAAMRARTGVSPLRIGLDEAPAGPGSDADHDADAAARAEGRGLTVDEAVAWVLRGRTGRKRPAQGWDSLTPAEVSVVKLVAQGHTNAEVASRLFMSPRTVSTHLSHVFAKLGVKSRTELVGQAVRRGV